MNIVKEIDHYLLNQPEPKRSDLLILHRLFLSILPEGRLWFLDGLDDHGKVVSNPNIGYGLQNITYADGHTRDFYQIGLSANKTGISIYILGLKDKNYLSNAFAPRLGKAKVTGYCIRFKSLSDIDPEVLEEAIRYGIDSTNG